MAKNSNKEAPPKEVVQKRQRADSEDAEIEVKKSSSLPNGAVVYLNKRRVLVFGSRGTTARYRHLMDDIRAMLPHHKRESKLDAKDNLTAVNDVAQMKGCDTTIFFEVRKHKDLFLWLAKTPNGPSVKFHVVNVHTMDELRLTGNCLKGSRPILSFDRSFDDVEKKPHLRLIREMFTQAFATPRGHPKSQPFHDHVLSLGFCDGKIWFRHYQIVDKAVDPKEVTAMLHRGEQPTVLVEIGPRFVLDIIRIFSGSMGGATIYNNPDYVSPTRLRFELAQLKGNKYNNRKEQVLKKSNRIEELELPENPLDNVFRD